MGIELVRERLTTAADALSNLDVSELDADELRAALDHARIVGSHVSRLQVALTARATTCIGVAAVMIRSIY